MSTWDRVIEIIKQLEPLLLVVIPTCFGIYIKIKNKIKEKEDSVKKQDEAKRKEKFLEWEHKESLKVIDNIKSVCNYYKDIGHMDLVNYIQFENGTTATSKLCNMFLSCLAEDSRFGKIPNMISNIQRISYSRMSSWVNNVSKADNGVLMVKNVDSDVNDYSDLDFIANNKDIKSFISGSVRDSNGVLIGICSFFYSEYDWCGRGEEQCIYLMNKYITSIETIFLEYNTNRKKMKKSLRLD